MGAYLISDRLYVALAKRVGFPNKDVLAECRAMQKDCVRDGVSVTLFSLSRFEGILSDRQAKQFVDLAHEVVAQQPDYARDLIARSGSGVKEIKERDHTDELLDLLEELGEERQQRFETDDLLPTLGDDRDALMDVLDADLPELLDEVDPWDDPQLLEGSTVPRRPGDSAEHIPSLDGNSSLELVEETSGAIEVQPKWEDHGQRSESRTWRPPSERRPSRRAKRRKQKRSSRSSRRGLPRSSAGWSPRSERMADSWN